MIKTKMKWIAASLLAAVMLVPGFASAADMKAKVDYSGVVVMQKGGQDWVPLRQIAKSLGYEVMWDKMGKVTLTEKMMMEPMSEMEAKDGESMNMNEMKPQPYMVSIMIGKKEFMVGMDKMTFAYAPIVMKNTTYVTKSFVEKYLLKPMTMMESM